MEKSVSFSEKFNGFLKSFSNEQHLIGASLVRIGFGIHILYFYVLQIFQKDFLWGANGVYPWEVFSQDIKIDNFSIYSLSNSPVYFNIIFFTGILIGVLYLIGYKTRFIGILNFIWIWSLYERNPYALDGGNNILIICLFYLLFVNTIAYFSYDAMKSNNVAKEKNNRYLALLHNFGVLACIVQLMVLYFASGLFKVQGKMWVHGTALYYVTQVKEYSLPSIAPLIYENPIIFTVGTYATVIFQLAFPFLIWNKRTKWLMAICSIMFHIMIAVLMGLVAFGLAMITIDLILFDDKSYIKLKDKLINVNNKIKDIFNKRIKKLK
ncbi:HTTM domain-containing protein [Bacillus cereus]|nr:HTTM domain-containing protein [Bacillus cereus]